MLCIILLYYILQHRAPHGWYINKVYEGRDMNFVQVSSSFPACRKYLDCVGTQILCGLTHGLPACRKYLGCVGDYLFPYKLGQQSEVASQVRLVRSALGHCQLVYPPKRPLRR